MSTIKSIELRERERQSLCLLVQAQWDLIMVRGLQVVAEREEAEMYAAGETRVEQAHEALAERIEVICKANGLSADGPTLELLDRIGKRLDFFEEQSSDGGRAI